MTAPLILFGLRHGLDPDETGLPIVVSLGREFLQRFEQLEGTVACREIRGDRRVPLRCIGVVRAAPVLCEQTLCGHGAGALSDTERRLCARVYADWASKAFHCARSVLRRLDDTVPIDRDVLAAASAFMGGTVFAGMTCSALTAGIMAIGLAVGEIENSRLRVLRMIATMAVGGDAFADGMNAFNRTMNLGHRLSLWFAERFGSTQCSEVLRCDFADPDDVDRYLEGDGTARCAAMARQVAEQVVQVLAQAGGAGSVARRRPDGGR